MLQKSRRGRRLCLPRAFQHFLFCFSKKENAGKRKKEPGGFRISPGPLKAAKKTPSVFLELSRANSEAQCKNLPGWCRGRCPHRPGRRHSRNAKPCGEFDGSLAGRCGHRPLQRVRAPLLDFPAACGIIKIPRALPANGLSPAVKSKRSNRQLGTLGRLLLFVCLNEQTTNADDHKAKL